MNTKKIAVTGMLSSLALALSFLENLLPALPFCPPGAKLGLSNTVVMFSVISASLPEALIIALVKAFYTLLTRGFTAGIISFSGGLLSCIVMFALTRKPFKKTGYIGVSVLSAIAHNIGQLTAVSVISGTALIYYLPPLLIFGIIFGSITGIVLKTVMPVLLKIKTDGSFKNKNKESSNENKTSR